MSTIWLKNFVGIKCTDFEMLKVENPNFEFSIHVTAKAVQCGTIIGSLLVGPIYHQLNGGRGPMRNSVMSCGAYGAGAGLLVGPLVAVAKLNQLSRVDVFDRCYRLRFDNNRLNMDRATVAGALAGTALNGAAGFVVGVDLALLASFIMSGTTPLSNII